MAASRRPPRPRSCANRRRSSRCARARASMPRSDAERVDCLRAIGRAVVVDDHEPARPHLVVDGLEDRGHLLRVLAVDPQQRDVVDRRLGEGLARARPGGSARGRRAAPKRSKPSRTVFRSGGNHARPVLVGRQRPPPNRSATHRLAGRRPRAREVRRQEDRRARRGRCRSRPGRLRTAALADRVEAPLQVVQARAPDLRQRERVVRFAVGRRRRQLAGAARLLAAGARPSVR